MQGDIVCAAAKQLSHVALRQPKIFIFKYNADKLFFSAVAVEQDITLWCQSICPAAPLPST